jgi:hypothetical protein
MLCCEADEGWNLRVVGTKPQRQRRGNAQSENQGKSRQIKVEFFGVRRVVLLAFLRPVALSVKYFCRTNPISL